MFVNAIFAFYSYIDLGLPDVGSSAPSAYSGQPVWFDVHRARAEQLLVEVLATLRSGASKGALEGGCLRVTKDMASALRSHYGLEPQGQTVGAERVDLGVLEFLQVVGTVDITEYLTPSEREQYLNVDRVALEPPSLGGAVAPLSPC